MQYRLRPQSPVEAFQWNGEPIEQMPDWIQELEVTTNYGVTGVRQSNIGTLLLPTRSSAEHVYRGDFFIKDGDSIRSMPRTQFEAVYEPAD